MTTESNNTAPAWGNPVDGPTKLDGLDAIVAEASAAQQDFRQRLEEALRNGSETPNAGLVVETMVCLTGLARGFADEMRERGVGYNLARSTTAKKTTRFERGLWGFGKAEAIDEVQTTVTGYPVWVLPGGKDLSNRNLMTTYRFDEDTDAWRSATQTNRLASIANNPYDTYYTQRDKTFYAQAVIGVDPQGRLIAFDGNALVGSDSSGYFSFTPGVVAKPEDVFRTADLDKTKAQKVKDLLAKRLLQAAVDYAARDTGYEVFDDPAYPAVELSVS